MKNITFAKREVDGILLLDKPLYLTSNAALQKVKQFYRAKKAGHTGSLDPLASGMLPICLGEATKFSQFLLESDKTYCVKARLGTTTTTGDAEGEIVTEQSFDPYSRQQLETALQAFLGEIEQVPPMYSAIKHQGQPLYKLARQGVEIERKSRVITIYAIDLLAYSDTDFVFKVHCSKGTYVRTLVEDIGKQLSCGAYVAELRRSSVGPYQEAAMVTLDQLENLAQQNSEDLDKHLLPLSTSVKDWPVLHLTEAACFQIKNGQSIKLTHALKPGLIRLLMPNEQFLGVGEVLADGRIVPHRLMKH